MSGIKMTKIGNPTNKFQENQSTNELFEECRNDIMLYLNNHKEVFEKSYKADLEAEKNVEHFHIKVKQHKTSLQEKLEAYKRKLNEFHNFYSNLKADTPN